MREILDTGEVKNPIVVARLRGELAIRLAGKDVGDARAEVNAIADPPGRMNALVRLAGALPKSAMDRKRALLEEAIVQARRCRRRDGGRHIACSADQRTA